MLTNALAYEDLDVGDKLPSISKPAISRTTLALFAGASGDHNPIHIDIDFARSAGMDDVFAQGMLPMAYLGQLLTSCVQQNQIREFNVRFGAITHLGNELTCEGKVIEKYREDGEDRVRVSLKVFDQQDEAKLIGDAVFAWPTHEIGEN